METGQADLQDLRRSLRSLGTLPSQLRTSCGAAGLGTWTSQAGHPGNQGGTERACGEKAQEMASATKCKAEK